MTPVRPLLLFDIDGTLLVGDNSTHHAAIVAGLEEVYGLDLGGFSFATLEPWGKTDTQIARDALRAHGVPEERQAAALDAWVATAVARHAALVDAGGATAPAAPGASAALEALGRAAVLGLVTGNLEPIARRKLDSAGLGRHFPGGLGGFGSDHHERARLVALARERAAGATTPHPRERTAIIGDTPRDIACARADGVACIAVATGPFRPTELAEADAVIATLDELPAALSALGLVPPDATAGP